MKVDTPIFVRYSHLGMCLELVSIWREGDEVQRQSPPVLVLAQEPLIASFLLDPSCDHSSVPATGTIALRLLTLNRVALCVGVVIEDKDLTLSEITMLVKVAATFPQRQSARGMLTSG